MLYVRYVHLTKAKPFHKRQTYLSSERMYVRIMTARVQLQKNLWS
jgi:hypothetical protein